jgi:hypothetical protein
MHSSSVEHGFATSTSSRTVRCIVNSAAASLPNLRRLDFLRRYVPAAVCAIVFLVLLCIPLKIMTYGCRPPDDSLCRAAKAVSGKDWSQILVLNGSYQIDHEFGWSLLLQKIHQWFGAGTGSLLLFEIIALNLLAVLSALPWLKRPEAWLVTLSAIGLMNPINPRFLLGRAYLVTMAAGICVLFLWQTHSSERPRKWMVFLLAALVALSTYVHGAWYFWLLPIAAFFAAGQWRWGAMFLLSAAVGVFVGSLLTGHPIGYPLQAVHLAFMAIGEHQAMRTLATELRPFSGDIQAMGLFCGLVVMRRVTGINRVPITRDPACWLAFIGWVLGFKATRFWDDWGWTGLMVWMAGDAQALLERRFAANSFARLGLVCWLAAITYAVSTNDAAGRWSNDVAQYSITVKDKSKSDLSGWMPGDHGILYSAERRVFYHTFFDNPTANWRYIAGFEPTLMPDDDFKVYNAARLGAPPSAAYEPWVAKMRPEDRLVIQGLASQPDIPKLEWKLTPDGLWIGRLPRTNAAPAASSGNPNP